MPLDFNDAMDAGEFLEWMATHAPGLIPEVKSDLDKAFDPNEPRDDHGRWEGGGGKLPSFSSNRARYEGGKPIYAAREQATEWLRSQGAVERMATVTRDVTLPSGDVLRGRTLSGTVYDLPGGRTVQINSTSGSSNPASPSSYTVSIVDAPPYFHKNMTVGDVHVPAAGGDGKKKKKKPEPPISVAYTPEKGFEDKTFDEAGSDDRAFDYWINHLDGTYTHVNSSVEKLKIKHKTSIDAQPNELKALMDALNTNPSIRAVLLQALAVGKATRTITVIRHGATNLNNQDTSVDRIRGWKDVPLSEEGKEEAAKLAEKLSKEPPDHLVCSDLKRAHDTAKMIAAACDMKIDDVSKGFRPWDVGEFAGKSSKDAVPILAKYAVETPDQKTPGGESFNTFRSRFFNALSDAVKKYPGNLAVVTHHRGERLLTSWEKAGYPADGSIDAKEFTKKGETTAGFEQVEIPIDRLHAAASANVTKFVGEPIDYDNIFEDELEKDKDAQGHGSDSRGGDHKWLTRLGRRTMRRAGRSAGHRMGLKPAGAALGYDIEGGLGKTELSEDAEKDFILNVRKVDEEQRIFYGWAYVSEEDGKVIIDKQDDYILPEDLVKAAEDFTLHGGKLGDMHDARNVGRVVASFVTSADNCGAFGISMAKNRRGWILGFKVDDPEVWSKIKSGGQLELSIAGRGVRMEE